MTFRFPLVGCALVTLLACTPPSSQDDIARNAPPPAPQAQQPGFPNTRSGAQAPADSTTQAPPAESQNSYRSAQETYRAALDKAENEHKAAVENCQSLAQAARKTCKEDADAKLKIAKSEVEKLKPTS